MGQLSDQEAAFSIGNAKIEQQQEDGSWKLLGNTDGNGRWWIMKKEVRSGGRIRITKPGYHPLHLQESKFLQEYNLLMIPSDYMGSGEDDSSPWGNRSPDSTDHRRN